MPTIDDDSGPSTGMATAAAAASSSLSQPVQPTTSPSTEFKLIIDTQLRHGAGSAHVRSDQATTSPSGSASCPIKSPRHRKSPTKRSRSPKEEGAHLGRKQLVGTIDQLQQVAQKAYDEVANLKERIAELEKTNHVLQEQSAHQQRQNVDLAVRLKKRETALDTISSAVKKAVSQFRSLQAKYATEVQRRTLAESRLEVALARLCVLEEANDLERQFAPSVAGTSSPRFAPLDAPRSAPTAGRQSAFAETKRARSRSRSPPRAAKTVDAGSVSPRAAASALSPVESEEIRSDLRRHLAELLHLQDQAILVHSPASTPRATRMRSPSRTRAHAAESNGRSVPAAATPKPFLAKGPRPISLQSLTTMAPSTDRSFGTGSALGSSRTPRIATASTKSLAPSSLRHNEVVPSSRTGRPLPSAVSTKLTGVPRLDDLYDDLEVELLSSTEYY
ncbi:hypothetical protein GGF32_002457 [Allomyces javanicus]|nr:hypothetical protein GGF32_002457 [Allomyces javanicus]